MRVKKYLGIAILISAALSLTGCGESFPELTEEEYAQTVEFAVGLLMKYSNNGQAKLTYVDTKELQRQRAREEAQKAKEEQTQEPVKETPKPVEEPVKPAEEAPADISIEDASITEESGTQTGPVTENPDDTSSASDSNESKETTPAEDPDAIVLSSEDTQEIVDDIFLSYQGYSVSSSYPESSKSYVINADKGKKLLVLRFDLYNGSDSTKQVDLLSKNIMFQVILNGKNLGYTAVTFLPNDLSSYVGTIESRAHESLVVLTEIDQAVSTEIQSLGLIVTIDGVDQKVSLK